jgi:hypothetical protein
MLIAAAALLAIWPMGDLVGQLHSSADPSAQAAYYEPVRGQLQAQQQQAGAGAIGQRVEVVDTAGHWGSAYLSKLSLARGWDRQADNAFNPIFYDDGALTAATYHRWLDSLAVGWVALPSAPLDYASVQEGRLIRPGLPYLRRTWSNRDWQLFRVIGSQPLLTGARIRSVGPGGVVLSTGAAAVVAARIRWSPYLTVRDARSGASVPACVVDAGGWVHLIVGRAATVALSSHFDAAARLTPSAGGC